MSTTRGRHRTSLRAGDDEHLVLGEPTGHQRHLGGRARRQAATASFTPPMSAMSSPTVSAPVTSIPGSGRTAAAGCLVRQPVARPSAHCCRLMTHARGFPCRARSPRALYRQRSSVERRAACLRRTGRSPAPAKRARFAQLLRAAALAPAARLPDCSHAVPHVTRHTAPRPCGSPLICHGSALRKALCRPARYLHLLCTAH